MKEKNRKTIRVIFWGVGIVFLLGLSCIAGICIEREHQKILELQKEYVTTVAVVNMDDGVTVGSEQINYASQLISFPDENFTVTGLTDAKAGIENGTYAAYIIIPETFSASVTSIENDPRRVVLEYQYNPNLDETVQIQVMSDVNDFITILNSNIAYMYVDAVLTEFHRIQDDSSTILANDNSELERLESVNAALLIEAAEHVEETIVDNNIQPVELTSYASQNDDLLDSMLLRYMDAVQQAQNDYAAIQETRNEVDTSADNFFSTYNSVVYDTNAEQANILSEGKTSLTDAVGIYNQNIDAQRAEIENLIDELIKENESLANAQLKEVLEADRDMILDELMTSVNTELRSSLDNCQDKIEELLNSAYVVGYRDAVTALNDGITDKTELDKNAVTAILEMIQEYMPDPSAPDSEVDNLRNQLEKIMRSIEIQWDIQAASSLEEPESGGEADRTEGSEDDNDTDGDTDDEERGYSIVLSRDNEDTVHMILEQFRIEYDPDEISDIIQTCFVDNLQNVHQGQMARLEETEKILYQNMNDYEARLENYDPLSYIRAADLDSYIDDIEDNARGMLDVVEQNNSEYRTYAAEVYYTTSEHTSQLINSLNAANTQTTTNIENCIDDLKLSRLALNNQNVSMLESFTEALAYTRVGSQGNAEVYDYIVNPVVSRSTGEVVSTTDVADTGNEISIKTLLIILLGIGIAASLAGLVLSIRWQYKKRILT